MPREKKKTKDAIAQVRPFFKKRLQNTKTKNVNGKFTKIYEASYI